MKRLLMSLFFLHITFATIGAELEWLTDLPTALAKAREEKKVVMLDFTGSDWCGWCMRLKREILDQPAFAAFAKENLIAVEVDFPEHKAQSPALKEANEKLARTYGVKGYPTLIFLSAEGQVVATSGYEEGGPGPFIAGLEKIPGMRHVDLPQPAKQEAQEPEIPRKPVAFVPIPPAVATRYSQLALKGISGSKDRRMALINNETLMAGEKARVKVQDTQVEVLCKEIREDSVLIVVDGKQVELKLGQH
jgi:thioredoxin-related protein